MGLAGIQHCVHLMPFYAVSSRCLPNSSARHGIFAGAQHAADLAFKKVRRKAHIFRDTNKIITIFLRCPKKHYRDVSKNRETPQNGWFVMENLIKMDDLWVPLFSETSIGSPKFFRLLETIFNANGRIHTPSRGVSRSSRSTADFKLCGLDGLFLSAGYVFLMRNHFTLSHFYQSKIDKSFGSVGIEKMLEKKHVHTTESHHMRVLFFQADGRLDTVL